MRCHGRTAVIGPDTGGWAPALTERLERPVDGLDSRQLPAEAVFRTIVVAQSLEHLKPAERLGLLDSAWQAIQPGGRLLVVVANGECQPRHEPERLVQRDVKKLLRQFGRPVAATNQPFAWIVMQVRKPAAGTRRPNRTRLDRYRATARLCRGRVLELGCGEGSLSGAIHARGHEVIGVDMNADKIAQARATFPDVTFVERNILDLELPDAGFDTVVIAEVLEHVTDETGSHILDLAWRQVCPGGRLVVSVPNENSIPHPNHIRRFDRRSFARMLRPFGTPHLSTGQPFKWLLMHVDRPPR
jgi:2-polyprenyl-3-methyl-5-hydroxy-6-metoxy-1,4-benzoquinol methylase